MLLPLGTKSKDRVTPNSKKPIISPGLEYEMILCAEGWATGFKNIVRGERTFDSDSKIQGQFLGITVIVLEKKQPGVQVRIERGQIIEEALFS